MANLSIKNKNHGITFQVFLKEKGDKMFFKKRLQFQLDENIIKKNRIPILTRDKEWNKVFEEYMNRSMDSMHKELEKLIEEERSYHVRLKSYQEQKRMLMNKIIHFSDLINSQNNEDALLELENTKEELDKINAEIDEIFIILETYPKRIEKINYQLLKESVAIAYKKIVDENSRLVAVDNEIEDLRERLGILRDEKEELEKKIEYLYSFLHSIIGHEEMEKLDILFLKEKE